MEMPETGLLAVVVDIFELGTGSRGGGRSDGGGVLVERLAELRLTNESSAPAAAEA